MKVRLVVFHFSPIFLNAMEKVRLVSRCGNLFFSQERVTDDVSSLQLPSE